MKTLRLVAKLFGISLLVLGFGSSCKKDKDDVPDCITCTYSYGGVDFSMEFCKDDADLEWEDEFDSWEDAVNYIRDEFADYGGSCT
ncbi:MAG: hypothetical protein PVF73_09440 [Bacteroidales bacterium]|jgi:hypothetical protein